MFTILKPDSRTIADFLDSAGRTGFSYKEIGATRGDIPAGYTVDRNRILLGAGEEVWERAKAAICEWKMFDIGWARAVPADTPIEEGSDVAVVVSHFCIYSLNAARIVYVLDDSVRFGFAYGTLEDHGESGEEVFLVERNPTNGEVHYSLLAFSRPGHLFTYLGYPASRYLQKQFAKDSMAAMLRSAATIGYTTPK
ncbi:MAG: DUF1990 domain-containing protein [Acidobacteria bacterium]|nr:DUF1990 domain-containing protein [Acidobacteriota bacterium]